MRRRLLKKQILGLLEEKDWPEIQSLLNNYKEKDIINHLFTALCSTSLACKWHGVSSFGVVVPQIAEANIESARIIMRRFLWCLNDESGGIGWGIPEAMGEVMANHQVLFEEYSHMLLSYMREDGPGIFMDGNHLELPALQQGLLWGAGRLLETRTEEMIERGITADIPPYLYSQDRIVQGMAIWCMQFCGTAENIADLETFCDSSYSFTLYQNHEFTTVNVGELAEKTIKNIGLREKAA